MDERHPAAETSDEWHPAAEIELSEDLLFDALTRIYHEQGGKPGTFDRQLFDAVRSSFDRAVTAGIEDYPEVDDSFASVLRHSADVFSAFKVHRAQADMRDLLLDSNGDLKPFEQWANDVLPIASHQFGPWLRTEYDTAVIRANQAANWQRFEKYKDILPNLKWMPSTSVKPGADHLPFWGTVRPVDDPFWSSHRPGDRWNCKCSLAATDDPATELPPEAVATDPHNAPQSGLKSNPGKQGKLFDESHPYFPKDCGTCPFNTGFKAIISRIFTNRKKDCNSCSRINERISDPEIERRKAAKARYKELRLDPDYIDVELDKKTGGVKATHIGHINHDSSKAQRFFGNMTSSDLERECQHEAYKQGHTAILLDEGKRYNGKQLAALDMELDGVIMDIKSVTGHGWYSNIFVDKNDQLRRYNARPDIKEPASVVCLYFHDPTMFSEKNMLKSIPYFKYYRDKKGNLLKRHLKKVYCIIRGETEIRIYDI